MFYNFPRLWSILAFEHALIRSQNLINRYRKDFAQMGAVFNHGDEHVIVLVFENEWLVVDSSLSGIELLISL
ncbi:hypothetical protein [Flavilitoribacter nigricans]|uniref:Uncharacterized protein n=1 Tax=Flavilitoribacter nigricans (strain ATCC 23147 / DSM 23189 / NBRC 102662 / NCIMB 1420 / SS-2) TaxID=1122177 RepID=A0A2D0N0S4_FLAN2|nr:hypothetical protein [Flavilitoribacter nigricans]PHN01978.1 hypothetical protein CRP01_34295 [Flavilitoribacter nigricans DSM 23189 = NBRC 102662]